MRRVIIALAAGLLIVLGTFPAASPKTPSAAARAARTRLLGKGWDAPDQVRLRWFGVTNFIASFGGHVVLLDAWVIEGGSSGYVPTSVQDLIAARPEYIYVGHGHFDHLAHAGQIAAATGAKIVGTVEHCADVKDQVTNQSSIGCVSIVDRATRKPFSGGNSQVPSPPYVPPTPFGSVGEPLEGPPGLKVTVVMGKHSAVRFPDPEHPRAPVAPPSDPSPTLQHPPTYTDLLHMVTHAGDAEGGTLIYRFDFKGFTLVWHDSVGPVSNPGEGGANQIRRRLAAWRDVDVEIGALQGFNQLTNGLKDLREYIEAIRPKVYIPVHHDNWLPPAFTSGRNYYPPFLEEFDRIPAPRRPGYCFITDPDNYLAPLVFKTSLWSGRARPRIAGCYRTG